MTTQTAIFEPIPPHARHLFFDLVPGGDVRAVLAALAAASDGQSVVLGIGAPTAKALNVAVPGLRAFPHLPHAQPPIPATQHALWLWLRGDEPGNVLLQGHALERLATPAFLLRQSIVSFRHQDYRDLTGYEDGTENPEGEAAVDAVSAMGQGIGIDGSSYAAIQQWLHDFDTFDRMPPRTQNDCFGRRLCGNVALNRCQATAGIQSVAEISRSAEVVQQIGSAKRPFQALMAAIRVAIPTICITRFRLYASTCKLISVCTCSSVRIRKCLAPIQNLMVPKGCSTVCLRMRITFGLPSSRFCIASRTSSCSQRLTRR